METIVARRSIKSYSWAVLAGIAAGLIVYRLTGRPGSSLALGLLLAAGPPAYGLLQAVLGQGELLRVDEAGITDHRLKIGPIPWEQIDHLLRVRKELRLCIKDPDALGIRRSLWRRMNQPFGEDSGKFRVVVRLGNLDVPANEIANVIEGLLHARRNAVGRDPEPAGP